MIVNDEKAAYTPPFIVNDAHAGTVVYPPGGKLDFRIQQGLQLVLLHTGSMDIHIDGHAENIPVGHVTLLKPGHSEKFYFAEEEETWHRWISVSTEYISTQFLEDLYELPPYIPISDRMNELTTFMLAISRDHHSANKEVIRSLGQSAIWLYITECRNQSQSNIHPAVLKAKETIQRKYFEELGLIDIAKESHISQEHLIRLFQKQENMTPIQYLWSYRVDCGMQLLRSTGLQIGEIAFQTGFKSSYHFSRAVKKNTGKTPTQIREEARHPLTKKLL